MLTDPIATMKDRIKALMESQHMTQQVFADFIGISSATLSGIFNERTKPTLNIVEAVKAKFPDISLDWLMYGSGSMCISAPVKETASSQVPSSPASASPAEQQMLSFDQEPVLDFGDIPVQPTPQRTATTSPRPAVPMAGMYSTTRNMRPEIVREEVKIIDKPTRRVTEIRVYYDDQTWESFVPAKK